MRAVNSAGECYLHTVEVTGSNPVPPTIYVKEVTVLAVTSFFVLSFFCHKFKIDN